MKKGFMLAIAIFSVSNLFGQFNLGFGMQYGQAVNGQNLGNVYDLNIQTDTATVTEKRISLGGGFSGFLSLGYQVSPRITVELKAGYSTTNRVNAETTLTNVYLENKLFANVVSLQPSLLLNFGERDGRNLYSRLGAIYNMGSTYILASGNIQDFAIEREMIYYNSNGLGFVGALGGAFSITKRMEGFAELYFKSLSISPSRASITSYTIDGENQLDDFSVSDKEFIFLKEFGIGSGDINQPTKSLPVHIPMNGIGISVGIRYQFGKES